MRNDPLQKLIPFDDAARLARDEALDRVLDNEKEVWKMKATELVLKQIIPAPFTGETLRLAVEEKLGRPHHHNTWGAMVNAWRQAGFIVKTASLAHMKTKKSHARLTPLYIWPETTPAAKLEDWAF